MVELTSSGRLKQEVSHPLVEAARVALEADLTPRMIKFIVDHEGKPIEILPDVPVPTQVKE